MKEIRTNSNTVTGAIKQLYNERRGIDDPVFMEINDLIIIVSRKKDIRWKRDIDKIIYDEKEMLIIKEK